MKCKYPILQNDYGTVKIDDEAKQAIEMIQDMAASMQMTPEEFISIFEFGVPECPHCEDERKKGLN